MSDWAVLEDRKYHGLGLKKLGPHLTKGVKCHGAPAISESIALCVARHIYLPQHARVSIRTYPSQLESQSREEPHSTPKSRSQRKAARDMDPGYLDTTPAVQPPPGETSNFVDPVSRCDQIIILIAMASALVVLFVLLRIYTRLRVTHAFGADDCKPHSSRPPTCHSPTHLLTQSLCPGICIVATVRTSRGG